MPYIRIGGASCNLTPFDWSHNEQVLKSALASADREGIQILCLPELCLTTYDCQDGFYWKSLSDRACQLLLSLLPLTANKVVTFGLPIWVGEHCYNGVVLVVNQTPIGIVCKQHLATQGVHYEQRWFTPWPIGVVKHIQLAQWQLPIGDLIFDIGGIRLGFEICEDAWVPDRRGVDLIQAGVQIILNPSASHFAIQKVKRRHDLIHAIIDHYPITYVYCNQLGNIAGHLIYDGDVMIGHQGHIHSAPRFTLFDFQIAWKDIDVKTTAQAVEPTGRLFSVPMSWQSIENPTQSEQEMPAWEKSEYQHFEECVRAISLGLADILRKTKTTGFVLNLSGGMDSALCALLVWAMQQLLITQLGFSKARARLPALHLQHPLQCLYQATQQSSKVTQTAAAEIAQAIHAPFSVLSIQPIVDAYEQCMKDVLGRPLTWESDDIAKQNIQARVRAPSAWLLANVNNAILLATNNRSEIAMGYTTMDGDTAGVFAPIGGLDKAWIRRCLAWWQKTGPQGLGPMPALAAVTAQSPTAELRPSSAQQTDEKDLMPYDIIEIIGYHWLVLRQTPRQIIQYLCQCRQETETEIAGFVDKYFQLWAKSQWKRERMAITFHLDDYNLSPKTGCRYPILSC